MTPQTITITTARGETFTMNFDGPVTVVVKDVHLSPFEVGDVMPSQSAAHEYKLLDLVLTQCEQVGKVVTIYSTNGITHAYGVEMPDSRKVKFLPWELRPHTSKFSIGDTVEWTDKRLGKKSGVVTDIVGHVLNIGPHVMVWDDQARKVTPSTAPKFKVGDVVWWETLDGARYYGRVKRITKSRVYFEVLTTWEDSIFFPIGSIQSDYEHRLHHDYRTVAGGGWRKCEVGKWYKTSIKDVRAAKTHFHDENGYRVGGVNFDLIEELP